MILVTLFMVLILNPAHQIYNTGRSSTWTCQNPHKNADTCPFKFIVYWEL